MQAEDAVSFDEGESTVVNWDDVEDSTFEALPKGSYLCTIAECEFTYSQASSNPMWTVQLEVSEGEYAGRRLFTHLVFAGGALAITKQNLQRIAPELLEGAFDAQDEETIASMLGKEVKAKVTQRMFEGTMRNNVGNLYPGGGDGFV